jgi:GDP-L-fucose synthase
VVGPPPAITPETRIFIAGHRGLVGSGLLRLYETHGFGNLITRTREQADLSEPGAVRALFAEERPEVVYIAAAKVGGIRANVASPVDFLHDNLVLQCNLLRESWQAGAGTVVLLGSSCTYPRAAPQPMKEEYLMTGPLEPTNEGYALAKLAGLKLAQYYEKQHGMRVVNPIPCNVYGTNDHFDLTRAHVLSSLVRRFVDAVEEDQSEVTLWGTGTPRREFIHVDDLCVALDLIASEWRSSEPINVGPGTDVSIAELAALVSDAVGYGGRIRWDTSMPDGMPRKCLEVSLVRELGFTPQISLEAGIEQTVAEYRSLRTEIATA